jgi:hypothetical protein
MVWFLCLAGLFVLAELGFAYRDGYAFAWQVCAQTTVPARFLVFWKHAGMWGDFFIINPIIAYVLEFHSRSWELLALGAVFTVVALVGVLLLIPLLEDSRTTPSAFSRDGSLTVVGTMHYLYFTISTTVVTMFYLFTPWAEITELEMILITLCLIVHCGLGVLHPPYVVHGEIHLPARVLTGLGWILLIGFAVRLLHFV